MATPDRVATISLVASCADRGNVVLARRETPWYPCSRRKDASMRIAVIENIPTGAPRRGAARNAAAVPVALGQEVRVPS